MYIDTTNLLVWILVGLVAEFLAAKVLTGHGFGIVVDILVGIVGAFLGGFMAGLVGLSATTLVAQIVVAFIGAVVLLMLLRLVGVGSRRRRSL